MLSTVFRQPIAALFSGTGDRGNQQSHGRAKNFHRRYLALCRTKNFNPIAEIANPKRRDMGCFLDVYCDRYTGHDWQLIAKALSEDRSLQRLALRLRKAYTEVFDGSDSKHRSAESKGLNRPAILEKRLFKPLIESLVNLLSTNNKVESFTLEGLPLAGLWTNSLTAGLKRSSSLTELNLARCSIGDEGCETICREIKHLSNVQTLNLSACLLTARGCQALAEVIKFQKIQRYGTSWELSLRYGEIKDEKLFGLKYLFLSHNPLIGDGGLLELTEVLKDDAWLREVHVCNCGLTDAGAQMLLECLHLNASIEKFDIRENMEISSTACHEILTKLGGLDIDAEVSEPPKKSSKTLAGLREQCELYETQLDSERERNSNLESMVEQLHLKLGDYAMQMTELQRQLANVATERNEFKDKVKKLESRLAVSKTSGAGRLRKTQSEHPNHNAMEMVTSPRSEMMVPFYPENECRSPIKTRTIERSIGDSYHNVAGESLTHPQISANVGPGGDGLVLEGCEPSMKYEPADEHFGDVEDPTMQPREQSDYSYPSGAFSVSELLHVLSKLEGIEFDAEQGS